MTPPRDGSTPGSPTTISAAAADQLATRMTKTLPIDIEFTDLNYSAGRRRIIKGISGHFKSGELTAIMGPSGAGKSSVMNILVGYVTSGVSGSIKLNGQLRQMRTFHKISSYIMQEDLLQPYLTVRESMLITAHLKLGPHLKVKEKKAIIEEILATLGLTTCGDTKNESLSGGQRKRVSIALELVNNPPVIFLDEPTTGLDVVSINQCLHMLKLLASQGRTIVCTLHQPSSSLFNLLDRVYMLAQGKCIYQGAANQLVPFLADSSLLCPSTHNPADYIFEVLDREIINRLSEEIQNGRTEKLGICAAQTKCTDQSFSGGQKDITDGKGDLFSKGEFDFPTSFSEQFTVLLGRMWLQKFRNKTGLWLQFIHHLISGLLIGTIFMGVGNDASRPYENFKFCLCVTVFFMYTHCMTPVLTYPEQVKLMKREYFNRWYSLKAFYCAITVSTIPIIMMLGFLFTIIVYFMSDQPVEPKRFGWFTLICTLLALISEGLGILIGFTFNCTNGTVVGPSTMAPILMLAMQGMGYGQSLLPAVQYLMQLSYLRFGLVGIITALYLDNRIMPCKQKDDIYCFYRDPKLLVRDLAMGGQQTIHQLIGLVFYLFFFRIVAFFCLRYRVTTEFSNRILNYIRKIIKRK